MAQIRSRIPPPSRDHLALKFRQNWQARYPLDTCSNGEKSLDDSLTSLNWLQNLNIMKITTPTPPPSPIPCGVNNQMNINIDSFEHHHKNMKVNPNSVLNVSTMPPVSIKMEPMSPVMADPTPMLSVVGDNVDYKTNPYVKPPYSYATLICMAMKETKKSKITLSAIYNWITENFMYYRLADPSWQNSIRHNLSLNKCFQKVQRRKDEPGKGGFWRLNPEYSNMIENGIFKKRRGSRDSCPAPVKKVKTEFSEQSSCGGHKSKKLTTGASTNVVHFGISDDENSFKGDFNWTSILNQDIEIAGIKIKTEELLDEHDDASPIMAMSPPSSDSNCDDFTFEELFSSDVVSAADIALDQTTNDPLDLSITGTSIRMPDWWAENFNLDEPRDDFIHNSHDHSEGLHTPIHMSSPVHLIDEHPWADSRGFADDDTAFDVDNLFDIENIPSPQIS